jgi:transportin-1
MSNPEFVETLILYFFQKLTHPTPKIRLYCLKCINRFLIIRSASILNRLPEFLQNLYLLVNDPDSHVLKFVCQSFVNIAETRCDLIIPILDSVIGFMLHCQMETDHDVAIEAIDFYMIFCERDDYIVHMQPYLPKLSKLK